MTRLFAVAFGLALAGPAWSQVVPKPETPPAKDAPAAKVDAAAAKDAQSAASIPEEPASAPVKVAPTIEVPTRIAPQPVHPAEPLFRRDVQLGLFTSDSDTSSSKYLEYRDVPQATLPYARLAGGDVFRYDIAGFNTLQDDQRYSLRASREQVRVQALYTGIPHRFGNEARSVLVNVSGGAFVAPGTSQAELQAAIARQYAVNRSGVNYTFLNGLITPYVNAAQPFGVELLRKQARVDLDLTYGKPVETRLSFYQENRTGNRGAGTSFGFSNVVETAEPIDYRTRDVGISLEWQQSWGLVRGSAHYNDFSNFIQVENFANPFRATDSTDPSAYTAPGSGSIGGAAMGRLALPPDNKALTGSVGATFKFAGRSRLALDTSLARWTQDQNFIPFSTNTAITTPVRATDVRALPQASLGGRIDVFTFAATFNSSPVRKLHLNARLRRYDLDNKTPRVEFEEGYVRFDAVWEDIPRISVPYGYTNDQLQASASYDLGSVTLEGGYKLDRMDRTFRESERTTQHVGFASALVRIMDGALLRATYEKGHRGFDHYELEHSEEASFLDPGAPTNQEDLRRFDQAEKDLDRLITTLQVSPGSGSTTFALSYVLGKDHYTESPLGLQRAKTDAFSAEVGYAPNERVSTFLFYTRENADTFQKGRQSGAAPSTNPLDDWTADIRDKGDTYGAGLDAVLKPDKLDFKAYGSYQKLDGHLDVSAPVGGAPEMARRSVGGLLDIPAFDDTRIWTINAELVYHLRNRWRIGIGGWMEDYRLEDPAGTGLPNYTPGALFLAGNDGNYQAHAIYARLSYAW